MLDKPNMSHVTARRELLMMAFLWSIKTTEFNTVSK